MNGTHGMRALALTLSCLLLSATGCKKDSPVAPPGGGGGPQGGGAVSPAARMASFASVKQLFETVDWTNPHAAKLSLLQLVRNRPEFEASDTNSNTSLWARFADGRLLIIKHTVEPDSGSPNIPSTLGIPSAPSVAGGELPASQKASVLNAMGTRYIDPTPLLSAMLKAKGYKVSNGPPTVDNLAKINGDGVFYLNSHGGDGTLRNGTSVYSVWTTTPVDTVNDELYKTMWANGELAYFEADVDRTGGVNGPITSEVRFAITKEFVKNEMAFGTNSLVYIDACGSMDNAFMNQCVASSTGLTAAYAGWSDDSPNRFSGKVAYFVIDRLLGTNMDPNYKEDPPQRPFRYPEILQELAQNHLNSYAWTPTRLSKFDIQPPDAAFGLLAPSIEQLSVDERNKKLYLLGYFGSDGSNASVTINDQPLPISDWSIGEIHCTIPTSGPNTSGDVKVIVNGDTSNTVQLTEWKGEVQVVATFPGSIGYTVTYSFDIRGDVHAYREHPGAAPVRASLEGADALPASFAFLSAGGSISDISTIAGGCPQGYFETWPSAHDSVPTTASATHSLAIAADLRPQSKTLSLYLAVGSAALITDSLQDSMWCPDSPPQGGQFVVPAYFNESDTLQLAFDDKFNLLAAPTITRLPRNSPGIYAFSPTMPPGTAKVAFNGAQAIHPPDPKAGQEPAGRQLRDPRYAGAFRRGAPVGN